MAWFMRLLLGFQLLAASAASAAPVPLDALAAQAASDVSAVLLQQLQDIRAAGARLNAIGVAVPSDAVNAILDGLTRSNSNIVWAGIADSSGRIIAGNRGRLIGADVAAREWFRLGQRRPSVIQEHEALLLRDLMLADGRPAERLLDFAVPLTAPPQACRRRCWQCTFLHPPWPRWCSGRSRSVGAACTSPSPTQPGSRYWASVTQAQCWGKPAPACACRFSRG